MRLQNPKTKENLQKAFREREREKVCPRCYDSIHLLISKTMPLKC